MLKTNIACYYHPTTVVFVDDNRSFLDNILLGLDDNISAISFTDPAKAIEYLHNHTLASFTDKYLRSFKDDERLEEIGQNNSEHSYVDVDVFNIHKEIYNANRFSTVVVVVVDYTMPGMTGLELCQSLKGLPFKFILITGDATLNNSIEAFNAGLIHQFIPKSSYDFTHKLQNIIVDLQYKQFEEFSNIIIRNLSTHRSASLNDPLLITFLKDFFKSNNIIEHYLINESGCFLLANAKGELSWMVVKSEEEMAEYTNIAIDNYGKEEIIEQLQSRKKILFLYSEKEHIKVTVDGWKDYLYPAAKLIGKNNIYYYSHVKQIPSNNIFANKIVCHDSFLATK